MTMVLSIVLLIGGNSFEEGVTAYQQGRYEDAYAAFQAAEKEAGDEASAELAYNLALTAVKLGRLPEAEIAVASAVRRGGAPFESRRDFLLGNIAYARCDQAVATVKGPEAGPLAYDTAIAYAKTARDAWRVAAMSQDDWPEARRNVERAEARIRDLERQKAATKNPASKKAAEKKPEPKRAQPPPKEQDPKKQESRPDAVETELTREQILQLLSKLGAKEKEKAQLRSKERGARARRSEKDW